MAKTRTEIFIETNETYIIKRQRFFVRDWCKICERQVSLVSPSEAASLMCQETKIIYSLIDDNQIHCCHSKTEIPLICLRSLCLI
jgi:hypothetical protein